MVKAKEIKLVLFFTVVLGLLGACATNNIDKGKEGEQMINSRIETEELIVYLEPEIIEDVSEVPNLTYIVENNSEEQLPVSHGLIEFYDEAADEWVDSGIMIVSDMMMRYVEPSETFSREIPTEQMADEEDGLYRLAVAVGEEEFLLEFYKGEVSR